MGKMLHRFWSVMEVLTDSVTAVVCSMKYIVLDTAPHVAFIGMTITGDRSF